MASTHVAQLELKCWHRTRREIKMRSASCMKPAEAAEEAMASSSASVAAHVIGGQRLHGAKINMSFVTYQPLLSPAWRTAAWLCRPELNCARNENRASWRVTVVVIWRGVTAHQNLRGEKRRVAIACVAGDVGCVALCDEARRAEPGTTALL